MKLGFIRCIWLFTLELCIHSSSLFWSPTRAARSSRAVASDCSGGSVSSGAATAFLAAALLPVVRLVAAFLAGSDWCGSTFGGGGVTPGSDS